MIKMNFVTFEKTKNGIMLYFNIIPDNEEKIIYDINKILKKINKEANINNNFLSLRFISSEKNMIGIFFNLWEWFFNYSVKNKNGKSIIKFKKELPKIVDENIEKGLLTNIIKNEFENWIKETKRYKLIIKNLDKLNKNYSLIKFNYNKNKNIIIVDYLDMLFYTNYSFGEKNA